MFDDQMLQCIFSSGGRAAHLFSLCGISALFLRFEIDFVILCFSNASSNIWQRCLYNDGRLFFFLIVLKTLHVQDFLTFSYSPVSESAMSAAEQCVYV